jgi:alpha-galactosidase
MNKILPAIVSILLTFGLNAQETIIPITTNDNVILLQTSREGRLSTVYLGVPLQNKDEFSNVSKAFLF